MNIRAFIVLVMVLFLVIEGDAWRRRRRRRRRACTPVNCTWRLGSCSTTCGPGTKTYMRTGSNSCGGSCTQPAAVACNLRACPINCVVSTWASWATCSKTCGGGTQTRSRSVTTHPHHGGTLCPTLSESRACSQTCLNGGNFTGTLCSCAAGYSGSCCQNKAVHCALSAWSSWSNCSKTCGPGGVSVRTRSVTTHAQHGGRNCSNLLQESKSCNEICLNGGIITTNNNTRLCHCTGGHSGRCCEIKPLPVHCAVSAWSSWSNCTKTCGGGTHNRTRSITTQPRYNGTACPMLQESKACNQICLNGGNFTGNRCLCVGGHTGNCCAVKPTPVHCVMSAWSSWSNCSKTCGPGGVSVRTRTVTTHAQYGGRKCSNKTTESKACNRICYNGGNFSSIQTGNMIGHACLCNGKFYGRCCEKPALVLNVNIYMYSITECIVWEPAPVIQRSCGENGALGGETGDTEGGNTSDEIQQLYDELLEENELNDLL